MASFSEKALENVKTKDLGEIGEIFLPGVVTELKSFDAEEEDRGFFGNLFRKPGDKISSMKAKYEKAETNISRICDSLESHQALLMKDTAMLDKMYEQNLAYFKELSMYILAGKKKLEELVPQNFPAWPQKLRFPGLPEDAQAVKDLDALCGRFEKKIHDLELTRMISIRRLPRSGWFRAAIP